MKGPQRKARLLYAARLTPLLLGILIGIVCLSVLYGILSNSFDSYTNFFSIDSIEFRKPTLDMVAYDKKLLHLAHVEETSPWYHAYLAGTTTPIDAQGRATTTSEKRPLWPVRAAYPQIGALLPFNRIVAYYGNFYSTAMGALGEYEPDDMLRRLLAAADEWRKADPSTPVIPAIHYIVETAQASPTKNGKYVARMPDDQVEKAIALAYRIQGIVFIDFQVGLSTLQQELPQYERFLSMPNVHLGLDPEFSMKTGAPPGRVIGTFDAADINWAAEYLAELVRKHNLPPKIIVVHRFTQDMLTNATAIEPLPEVQIVIDMDGWGSPQRKFNTYRHVVADEPVQFTGFKIFYKNDLKEDPPRLLTPEEVISLTPAPIYIQYQ